MAETRGKIAGAEEFLSKGTDRAIAGRGEKRLPVEDYNNRRRRANRPIPIRPVPNSNRLAGSGVLSPVSENAALNVGAGAPPTMSPPTRNQSGSIASSRVHDCRSVKPGGNGIGLVPDSHKNSPVREVIWTCGTKK